MASGLGLDILQDSGKFPCAMCRTGVGRSSIRCSKCNLWVHYKKCSGLKTLSEDLSYECPRCRGVPGIRPVDGRPFKEVEVGDCVLEAVDRFCYLGDMLSAGGGCMAAATARCRCAWGKFRENLPLLTSKPVPFDLRGRLFSSNVRSSMLHGTETWPMTSAALHRLCRNDRAMIRWICGKTWEECVKQDLKVCGLSEAGTQDRLSWRSSVKNSRQEPTPSNGSLLQSMAAPPARRVLGMRTRSFNKTGFDWLIDWTLGNKLQSYLDRNLNIFIQEIAFENVIRKMAAILSRPQCVNESCSSLNVLNQWQDHPAHLNQCGSVRLHVWCVARCRYGLGRSSAPTHEHWNRETRIVWIRNLKSKSNQHTGQYRYKAVKFLQKITKDTP